MMIQFSLKYYGEKYFGFLANKTVVADKVIKPANPESDSRKLARFNPFGHNLFDGYLTDRVGESKKSLIYNSL